MGKSVKREAGQADASMVSGGSEKHTKKKRKNTEKGEESINNAVPLATEKPTITIALPGSIIDNAQSLELATRLAGQIARAATIFRIDEVVIFDNKRVSSDVSAETLENDSGEDESGAAFLVRILRYLETPQYLRKSLFPKHNSLRFVGLLPPLDAPHHLRKHEWASYREGITLEKVDQGSVGTLVDVGLSKNVIIDQVLERGRRVTVDMGTDRNLDAGPRKIVPSLTPREKGMYWGYKVRYAPNISSLFRNCPYQGGYDYRIGTSEHGVAIKPSKLALPSFKHLLIAFGGLAGLEECVEEDANLKGKDVHSIFDSFCHRRPPPLAMAKQVQTDLSPVLKLYTDGTVERLFGSAHVPPSLEDASTGVSSKDTVISPEVSARIYLPRIADGRRKIPILVYYHGGGFCVESAFSFLVHRYINLVTAAAGALVVSVEYRLAPEHPLPAAFNDSWEALIWLCSHGDENTHFEKDEWITDHGDLNQIFVGGDSAGGTIAHNIALRAGSDPLPGNTKIAGAILSHPYFLGSDPIGNEPKEGMDQTLLYRLWVFAHPTAAGGIDDPLINPLSDPALSGLGCSKLMVCLSEKDQLTARGLAYAEKVKESGWKGEIEVVVVDGEDHCFQIFDPETEKAKDLICRIANFILGSGN
ncbi:Unknown protein [Striga hermonthica]|uniref:Alpha/beta hydrolase fold-3 domain-containing protein n=1 Tax=Striga hermonthica TaxID=68872 RepID=A0A9N7NEH3_STRHE|nr:Unknown protein [Striga hermonthica]